ncbi:MAG: alpha/beta fold hydrolase [Acinetobacter sp.]
MIKRSKIDKRFLVIVMPLLLAGCQLVKLQEQKMSSELSNNIETILTHSNLSSQTSGLLFLIDQSQSECLTSPDRCISKLNEYQYIDRSELYSSASELYLAGAMKLEHSSQCDHALKNGWGGQGKNSKAQICIDQALYMLDKSIRYSYMYLFKTEDSPQSRVFSIRQSQVRTFYNYALSRLMTLQYLNRPFEQIPSGFSIGQNKYSSDFQYYPALENLKIEHFKSSYNMKFKGLQRINRRDGFGAEFVVVRNSKPINKSKEFIFNPEEHSKNAEDWNIYAAKYLPVTVVAEPVNFDEQQVLTAPFLIRFLDPYQEESASVDGEQFKISGNFSVPYGLWLSENNFGALGYKKILNMGESSAMPHLFMIEPYQPNKKVIVLIHGLASSPEAWVDLTNNIMGDKVLRDHYQVWQVFYSTNMPIWESRYQINALLKQAFSQTIPNSVSSQDAVLIGHSMGGVISRLLLSQADVRANVIPLLSDDERKFIYKYPSIMDRFQFEPIPNFSRAVFIASPHRGTAFADRWFTRSIRRMISLPGDFFESLKAGNLIQKTSQAVKLGVATIGPSDLSDQSIFMQMTRDIQPKAGLKYHSIMGNTTTSQNTEMMTDGIVPYKSSHLDLAISEKIIKGGHSIQETPDAVHELQRILREQLQ